MARTAAYDGTGGPGGLVGAVARTSILVYAAVVLV